MIRGRPQTGQRVPASNVVRQSRQRAGMGDLYQDSAPSDRPMSASDHIPFHGAKLAILVGDSILVIQRDEVPTIPWPGYWDLPGGAREPGETPVETVLRETREELGIDVPRDRLLWSGCWPSPPSHIWLFVAEWPDFDPSAIDFGDEGQRFALAPIEWYLARSRAIPSQKKRLRGYLKRRMKIR